MLKLKLKKKLYDVKYVEFLEEKTKKLLDTEKENRYLRHKYNEMMEVFAHYTEKEVWKLYYDWVLHGWSQLSREERINEMDFAFLAEKRTDDEKAEFERFLKSLAELECDRQRYCDKKAHEVKTNEDYE